MTPAHSSGGGGAEPQPPQRKCGVHRINDHSDKVTVAKKKRSVDAVVEAYLDEHPAFLDDYVRRKVNRRQLEQWLFVPVLMSSEAIGPSTHSSDSNLLKTGGLLSTCVRGQDASGRLLSSRRVTRMGFFGQETLKSGVLP